MWKWMGLSLRKSNLLRWWICPSLLIAFACNAKCFAIAFLFFLFLFLVSAFGQTGKSYFQIFVQLLLWAHVIRIRVNTMVYCVLSTTYFWSKQYWWIEVSILNFPLQQLKALYLHYHNVYGHQTWQGGRVAMSTKFGRMVAHFDGLLPIKSHYALTTWSFEIMWQAKAIISPPSRCLWPRNLVGWWLMMKGS